MSRPSDGRVMGDLFAPLSTWGEASAARGAEEARAYALLVEAERIMRATLHRGVAYDISVAAEALLSVSTDEGDALINASGLTPRDRQSRGEDIG